MTATDELRAMLDERGVSWDYGPSGASSTAFWANGKELSFSNCRDGLVCSTIFTPAQAIAAMLGVGTCRNTQSDFDFMCSECSKCVDNGRVLGFNYCPNCGRRIEADE